MKIAFEGQLLLAEQRTGIAWCAHHLILELAKYPENECVIQYFLPGVSKKQKQKLKDYTDAGCKLETCGWFHNVCYKLLWTVVPVPYRIFFRSRPEITQFFNYAVPPGVRGKRVTFIYDMAYLDCPKTVNPKTGMWLRRCIRQSVRHADRVLTSSAFSKRRIHQRLHIPYDRIDIVPDGIDHTLYHPDYTRARIEAVLQKYHIRKNYILYLGTIEPRKNIETLVTAYEKLCLQMKDVPQLVLAGARGWLCDGIYAHICSARTEKKADIRCTGYIDQKDAPVLMCGARIFVFPSLYEGFGMPPLEAMACGTPAVVSCTASLPQVVGDAAVKVNPKDADGICRAMEHLLADEAFWSRMREAGIARAKKFTWEYAASKLMDAYKKL